MVFAPAVESSVAVVTVVVVGCAGDGGDGVWMITGGAAQAAAASAWARAAVAFA